ncbi:MAG: hypothetical protein ACYSWO_30380 [Planctomycetota bacterium]|jgi:hypothetical protein
MRKATIHLVVMTILAAHSPASAEGDSQESLRILEKVDVTRGIGVVLGDTAGGLASRLAGDTELLLYVQLRSPQDVLSLRRRMDAAGLLGRRVWVERGDLSRVHLADNLVRHFSR